MKKMLLSMTTVALLLAASGTAFAEEDCGCPGGMECVVEFVETCAVPEPMDCTVEPGEDGEVDCMVPPDECEAYEMQRCVPMECESNADCGGDTICVEYTYGMCSGSDCAPGEQCNAEPVCEEFVEAYCVPPYFAPCEVDADCGEGFMCDAMASMDCAVSSDDGDVDCVSEPDEEGPKACVLIAESCEVDTDCDGNLVCVMSDVAGLCPPQIDMEWDGDDGDPGEVEDCDPGDAQGYCAPEGYEDYYYGGGNYEPGSGEADGEVEYLGSQRAEDSASASGSGSSSSSAGGGCSTSGGPVPPAGLIALVALVWGLVWRRKQ